MTTELLIYAIVAGILVFWLRNTLGTRHGEERERPNPLTQLKTASESEKPSAAFDNMMNQKSEPQTDDWSGLPIDVNAFIGLKLIAASDRNFHPKKFIAGARDAFPLIVESFASEDKDLLGRLLAPTLYKNFDAAIKDRHARGETVSTEIHAVRAAEIIDADMRGRMAFVTVKFKADETTIIRNSAGTILSGNPDQTTEINDIWVFGRDTKSSDPTWFLYETRDDVPEVAPSIFPHSS
jgi:predicted lipid-binding transport protein (Tim44 family)